MTGARAGGIAAAILASAGVVAPSSVTGTVAPSPATVASPSASLHARQGTSPQPAPSASSEPSQPPPASVWAGAYTEEQAKRGEEVYRQECESCHGAEMTGGEEGKPLAGAEFTSNWNGLSVGDLFERIRLSMPPKKIGRLTRQQHADVLAYILSYNQFPTGKTELPRETDRLRLIQFEATKP